MECVNLKNHKRKREHNIINIIDTYCDNNINDIKLLNNINKLPISISGECKSNIIDINTKMTPRIKNVFNGTYNEGVWKELYNNLEYCIFIQLYDINSHKLKKLRDYLVQIFNHINNKYDLNIGFNKQLKLKKFVQDEKYMLYIFFNYKQKNNYTDIIIKTLKNILKIIIHYSNIKYDEKKIYDVDNNEYIHDDFVVSNEDLDESDEDLDESYEDLDESDEDLDESYEDLDESDEDLDESYEDLDKSDEDLDESYEDLDESYENNNDKENKEINTNYNDNNIFKKYTELIIKENKEYLQNISINKINSLLDDFINDLKNKIKKFIN